MSELLNDIEAMLDENPSRKSLDFYADVPCPMKPAFKEVYENMAKEHYKATGRQFLSYVPTSCPELPQRLERMIDLKNADSADVLPDIFFAYALEDLANPDFISKFTKNDVFDTILPPKNCQIINDGKFDDRYGISNIIALYTEVIMIDKTRIGNLPIPKCWDDLLDPVYKNSISMPGSHGYMDGTLMLYLYKKHGEKGLDLLEPNIKNALPGVFMMQKAGTVNDFSAPISVVSWMFANANIRHDRAELIWPEDGALTEPIVMLAKKNRDPALNPIIDFVLGEKVSSLYANNYLPTTNPAITNKLPENAPFQWLGWDYIYDNNMNEINEYVAERFDKYVVNPNEPCRTNA